MFAVIDKLIPEVIVCHIALFLFLFLILRKFLFIPILKHIDERKDEINKATKTLKEERVLLEEKLSEYERTIAEVKNKAQAEVQKMIKEALARKTNIISEAHSKAFQILQESKIEIDAMRKRLLSQLEGDIQQLSSIIREKVFSE